MRVSGFVMTDESGDVLAVSVGGSGDLLKAAACGPDITKAAPESSEELVAEHEHLVDVLRSPDHKDDLEEAAKQEAELAEYRAEAGEEMSKAHVKGYTRKDGTYVEEHDDSRQAAQAQQPSGRFEYPSHVKNWSDKAHFLEQIPESQRTPEWKAAYKKASAQSMYGKGHSPEYKAHLAASKGGASKGGDAYGHPNVVGKADFGKESPEKGWSMKFAGTEYTATGKEGNSMHDQTPVREFESEDGHRVWADGAGRVHADSTSEVAALRQKHEASAKPVAKKPTEKKVAVKSDGLKDGVPKEGEVGYHEHTTYGVYHQPGSTVKDNFGKTHKVLEHRDSQVLMEDGTWFHPTNVHKQGGKPMAKALLFVGSKSAAAELAEMAKSHVSAYTRKDGVFVGEHERPGQFRIGDPVKVTAPVMGQGQVGEIHDTAPSGHFHIVKFPDGSKSSYHESDLSLHEDGEDEFDDDEENDR